MDTSYLNEYYVWNRDTLIRGWNDLLRDYGVVTVCDLKDLLGVVPVFSDTKMGWITPINRKDFITIRIPTYLGFHLMYKLNLPNASPID